MTYDSGTRKRLSLLLGLAALLGLCLPVLGQGDWWDDAVFYEVFVRSFQDSDGDGIGDLQGLIDRLDYLNDGDPGTHNDLGITALWLMPICESPSYHGYDVTDYYAIESDYGTMDDFRQLLEEAHARGIRVVVDLVLNHTSNQHPWFVESKNAGSAYRDWYIWETGLRSGRGPWGQQVWHFGITGYYYGLFWRGMPDLNYRNPNVSSQMFDVVRFWLEDVGVDGFRLDAIRHLIESGERASNTMATHLWLTALRSVAKDASEQGLLLGEVWDTPGAIAPYLDGKLDLCFEFSLADAILNGVAQSSSLHIKAALETVLGTYAPGNYATFLANHDQERTMTRLGDDVAKAKLAASIQLTLPGTPFIYYGEEIGMTGTKPDERIRTPMQWDPLEGGGFTYETPWQPLAEDALFRTVFAQTWESDSLLSRYRALIRIRNAHPALSTGNVSWVDTGTAGVASYVRQLEGQTLWILHNLTDQSLQPVLAPGSAVGSGSHRAGDLLAGSTFEFTVHASGALGEGFPTLMPFETRILDLSGA